MSKDHGRCSRADDVSTKKSAELIAELTADVVMHGYDAVGFHCLKHTAGLVKMLTKKELRKVAEDEGIPMDGHATHSTLVVKIVAYLYSDVLEAADSPINEGLETKRVKKQRTKHCDVALRQHLKLTLCILQW